MYIGDELAGVMGAGLSWEWCYTFDAAKTGQLQLTTHQRQTLEADQSSSSDKLEENAH